jgi:hypothetical protein
MKSKKLQMKILFKKVRRNVFVELVDQTCDTVRQFQNLQFFINILAAARFLTAEQRV